MGTSPADVTNVNLLGRGDEIVQNPGRRRRQERPLRRTRAKLLRYAPWWDEPTGPADGHLLRLGASIRDARLLGLCPGAARLLHLPLGVVATDLATKHGGTDANKRDAARQTGGTAQRPLTCSYEIERNGGDRDWLDTPEVTGRAGRDDGAATPHPRRRCSTSRSRPAAPTKSQRI